jgi:hypothetical protein
MRFIVLFLLVIVLVQISFERSVKKTRTSDCLRKKFVAGKIALQLKNARKLIYGSGAGVVEVDTKLPSDTWVTIDKLRELAETYEREDQTPYFQFECQLECHKKEKEREKACWAEKCGVYELALPLHRKTCPYNPQCELPPGCHRNQADICCAPCRKCTRDDCRDDKWIECSRACPRPGNEVVISKWVANDGKREFREIEKVGWKEYSNGELHGRPPFKFKEIERTADYVILFTLDRGESNNFYLKITNEDIKLGYDKTNINGVLDNGKWTLFNGNQN